MAKCLTNEEFHNRLKIENPDVFTDTFYENPDTILNCTCIRRHDWTASARNVLWNHTGCPFCSGRQPIKGETDLWTTHPELAKLLKNTKDGYNVSYGSGKKVWWICPNCGEELFKTVHNVVNKGLSCNNCSDVFSFPNRFMNSLLKYIDIEFQPEYIIKGRNYRYDFYIPSLSCIIEMHGRQHYEEWSRSNKSLSEIQENDKSKYEWAISNGIKEYIVIDSRNSNMSFIKNNILKSNALNLLNLNNVNWNVVAENSFKSIMYTIKDLYINGYTVSDIAEKLKVSNSTVNKWLHKVTDLGLCEYIPDKGFLNDERKIVLINTKEIFDSISNASRMYNESFQNISAVCKRKRKYCGIINGQPAVWRYIEEYDENEIIDFDNIINYSSGHMVNQYKEDKYIDTYDTLEQAVASTGQKISSNISECCRKNKVSAGGYQWYYADDEMQPDKSKIIGTPRYYGENKVYSDKTLNYHNLINNEYKDILFDVYDRYGNYIQTCIGYKETENTTKCSKEQIYKCCSGKCAYAGDYVFRYKGDSFNKYFYPHAFEKYINVYNMNTFEFVGIYYSAPECVRQLKLPSSYRKKINQNLRKEILNVSMYQCFYANDSEQPDKTKIITLTN